MPASGPVAIANIALIKLGLDPIISLNDPSRSARLANARYEDCRDAMLRSHRWNCAIKRATLSQLEAAPTWGFAYSYQLPEDFIRFAYPEELTTDHRIEQDKILSDLGEMNIVYVFRLEDVNKMDEGLKQCIGSKLAVELCKALSGSESLRMQLMREHEMLLSEARYHDSLEGPVDSIEAFTWINSRVGSEETYRSIDVSQ
jgi:hypothetical protein